MFNKLIITYLSLQCIILIHEFGHLFFAKMFKYKVLDLNIGIGKVIQPLRLRNQTINIRLFPIGGFVTIEGIGINDQWLSATLTYLGGIIFNLLTALLCFMLINFIGYDSIKPRIIDTSKTPVYIEKVNGQSVTDWKNVRDIVILSYLEQTKINLRFSNEAETTHLPGTQIDNFWNNHWFTPINIQPWEPKHNLKIIHSNNPLLNRGDLIISINHQEITNGNDLKKWIQYNPNKPLVFKINRAGKLIEVIPIPNLEYDFGIFPTGKLNIKYEPLSWPKNEMVHIQYNLNQSLIKSAENLYLHLYLQTLILKGIFTGKISTDILTGPVGIFSSIYSSINYGLVYYLNVISLLSIAIALINIMPLPPADGGQIMIKSIESILNKKIPSRYIELLQSCILILLFIMVVNVTLNDIERWINKWHTEAIKYEYQH